MFSPASLRVCIASPPERKMARMARCYALAFLLLSAAVRAEHFPSPRDWRDLSIYMIFTDRFADGDSSNNERTPGAKARRLDPKGIHGGDFKGIQKNLEYIRSLGARAIWITPVHLNDPGSSWHGYGAVDFQRYSPQLGGLADLQELIRAAHRRGIYVILDVVANHLGSIVTSDDPGWPRFRNSGQGYQLRWVSPTLTPLPPFDNLGWFHNRGQVDDWFDPEQSVIGQFFSLGDLRTELPEVRGALIEAHQRLMRETDCDGFRMDTVRHVEPSFWAPWCSAMRRYAASLGKTNFFLFGEVALESDQTVGSFTGPSGQPERAFDSQLNYPLYYTINSVLCSNAPTRDLTARLQKQSAPLYSRESAEQLVTFIDNHDQPRFLSPDRARGDFARLRQGLALLYTLSGVPCLYYGTEQGFRGSGDPFNREDMIEPRRGASPARSHFEPAHPMYKFIARLHEIRAAHACLRSGSQMVLVDEAGGPGAFVLMRQRGNDAALIILNTAGEPRLLPSFRTPLPPGARFRPLLKNGPPERLLAGGEFPEITLPSRSVEIWVSRRY